MKSKNHVRIMFKDIFEYLLIQKVGTIGLCYKLTLTRSNDESALNKADAINNGKIKVNGFERYVSHYTPSMQTKR